MILYWISGLLLLLTPFGNVEESRQTVEVFPNDTTNVVTIDLRGIRREYFVLSHTNPRLVTVDGPGELRVLTRARLSKISPTRANYRLICVQAGGREQSIEFLEVGRADSASFISDYAYPVAQLRDWRIYLGNGVHRLNFRLGDSLSNVAARFVYTSKRVKRGKWYPFAPLPPVQPVDLVTNEQTTRYYRFSCDKPLRVEIIGPTKLRILTRVENSYTMEGSIGYRVQVRSKGRLLNTYQFSSARSEVTAYMDNSKLVPGRARELVINVPSGKNIYEIAPPKDEKASVLAQVLFPVKDISRQE